MINRFLKITPINNSFLRFIFLTRYLLALIFLSTIVIFNIPKFFSYDKQINEINKFLKKNYKIEILKYNKIKYKSTPAPGLLIDQIEFNSEEELFSIITLSTIPSAPTNAIADLPHSMKSPFYPE